MATVGAIGLGAGIGLSIVAAHSAGNLPAAIRVTRIFLLLVGLYGSGMACYMTYGSRVGKLRTRKRLLDLATRFRPWSGAEQVLDVGCGRGLLLIEAARRLTSGHANGVDLWRSEDQSANAPEAALRNARIEGVAHRVSIRTGDARELPFPAQSFDLVMSHWVLHNLPTDAQRSQAVGEMVRVLKPGGLILLADIKYHTAYRAMLRKTGLVERRADNGGWRSSIIGALSSGSFRPAEIIAELPVK
ncbi:SAM-dependent methyltransferase [Sphingomonas vulcanisoli]|uniref:SAM-dependent methyltransferase n=1 Tax=Sphingomonas vulcanisoli TaxID=1658060 RepID=A0ABX0TPE4_9SPHN|nr:class I SAM-dependent methyltransferase [Sphingomonas vulcanisoli]NIJ06629.1 SAM-dependent methyltransferase [Sphingomonas vulcanisoli]